MASDEAAAAVREEMEHFANGTGPYKSSDLNECAALFLERNHVVRIPEEGQTKVTQDGETICVDGHLFASSSDLFLWQQSVENGVKLVEARSEALRCAVLDLEKRRAVLAFLTQKQEAEKQRELEREKRRDELAANLTKGTFLSAEHVSLLKAVDMILDLQDELAARS